MKISLEQVSKKFYRHWIFRNIDYTFSAPNKYAILGANGSGKSTLIRLLAGMQAPTKGNVLHEIENIQIEENKLYPFVSLCAPGMDIIEEMTLNEFFKFHFTHKNLLQGLTISAIIEETGLQHVADKMIGEYSSGMRQRVKLAQAIFSDTPLLLLDEPCTNLDENGVAQYNEWIEKYTTNRLVIVASNDVREYFFCKERLEMSEWK